MLQADWVETTRQVNGLMLHVVEAGLELCDRGRLVIVEGATHWLHLEEPARVNAEIINFLAGVD